MKIKGKIIVIVGPTASGKSDLAIKIARALLLKRNKLMIHGAEIISADSRQVYKNMDIGTGKITKQEMCGIPHHMLDIVSPKKTFTVANYQKKAKKILKTLLKKNIVPIICGGTGFYIDALVYETNIPNVPPNPMLRKKLLKKSPKELFEILKKIDKNRAKSIDQNNSIRLIRAIEIASALGKVPKLKKKKSPYTTLFIGIEKSKAELRKRIHTRLKKRLAQGMIEEVAHLHSSGVSWEKLDRLGLEYRFVSRYLRGLLSRKEMESALEKAIFEYSKRQMTWFKKNKEITWIRKEIDALGIVLKFLS